MADINIAYLELRLSGGVANTDPNASLGGDISSERVLAQSSSALSNVTGVVIEYAAGNPIGAGTLTYTLTGTTLSWTPYGQAAGAALNVGTNGEYTLLGPTGSTGILLVNVTAASLPGSNQSDAVTIANIANETFDDVTKAESFSGDTEYRCVYLKNVHDVDPFLDIIAFISTQPTPGTISIGKDPAGVGDGIDRAVTSITRAGSVATVTTTAPHGYANTQSIRIAGAVETEYNGTFTISNVGASTFDYTVGGSPTTPATGTIVCSRGRAVVAADESTAPAGVTFTTPTTESTGISLGQLAIGESAAIWIRRVIAVKNTVANTASTNLLSFQAYF